MYRQADQRGCVMTHKPDMNCYNYYYGVASFECCGPPGPYTKYCIKHNHGSCGNCDNTKIQAAWPYLVTNGCDLRACGRSLMRLDCGDTVIVLNECNGKAVTVTIADCGPPMADYCGDTAQDCGGHSDRIIDLLPAAFSEIVPLSQGLFTCRVAVQVSC